MSLCGGGGGMLRTQFLLLGLVESRRWWGTDAAIHGRVAAGISEIGITGYHAKEENRDI